LHDSTFAGWPAGGIVAALGCLGWLAGEAAGAMIVKQVSFVLLCQGAVATLIGRHATRILALPLLYLYLMVPFGQGIVPYLQDVAATLVVSGLRLAAVPVHLEGIRLVTPAGSFIIAEACAGLRFTLPVAALALFYADLMYRQWTRRLLFLAIAIAVTILTNALRVLAIILIAESQGFESAAVADHLTYGWGFLSIVMALLFLLGLTFRSKPEREGGEGLGGTSDGAQAPKATRSVSLFAGLCVIVLALATQAYAREMMNRPVDHRRIAFELPGTLGSWTLRTAQPGWRPVFVGADAEHLASYGSTETTIDLYIAHYRQQRQGAEIVHAMNRLANSESWRYAGNATASIEIGGRTITSTVQLFQNATGRRRAVISWYWIGKRTTGNPIIAKALQALAVLMRGEQGATVYVVSADYEDAADEAVVALQAFGSRLGPPSSLLVNNSLGDRANGEGNGS
jgi:EpsI family protein